MNALVTGGAGFIGSHVVDGLMSAGHTVRVLDDLSSGSTAHLPPEVELVVAGVTDERRVAQAMQGIEMVFHHAAHRAVARSVDNPAATDWANCHGTVVVLKAAVDAGVRRLVFASSSSVYGGAPSMPTQESESMLPRSPYAVSKMAGEHYCRVFSELYGLETVCLRYFNVYGPRQNPESRYAAVIPAFVEALKKGRHPVVHGDGLQSRDFSYIADVVAANLSAARADSSVCRGAAYNIAGGKPYSLLELLDILGRILDVKSLPTHVEPRLGDVRHTHADVARAAADLRWLPNVSIEEGLERTVAWFEK